MSAISIAIDAMGGDQGLDVVIPALMKATQSHPDVSFVLVGQEDLIQSHLTSFSATPIPQIRIRHAAEVVEMDECPAHALRKKKDSSIRVAVNLVKEGSAHACVSAGNTGALMAISRFVLKTIQGIDRPAIISAFPAEAGHSTFVLDLGANVDSTPEQLTQFAAMGSLYVSEVKNIACPRVRLLNVGEEDIKGSQLVKQTAALLADYPHINYQGYIEGDQLLQSVADVVVCDGFVGNTVLKSLEGLMRYMKRQVRDVVYSSFLLKCLAFLSKPIFVALRKRMDPDRHNGACFLGLNGVVIKSHGGTSINGFYHALEVAISQARINFPAKLAAQFAGIVSQELKQG